jgi:hypothetical protein
MYSSYNGATDWWDSARFTGIFLASGLYCPQAESTPAHLRVTQTVGQFLAQKSPVGEILDGKTFLWR